MACGASLSTYPSFGTLKKKTANATIANATSNNLNKFSLKPNITPLIWKKLETVDDRSIQLFFGNSIGNDHRTDDDCQSHETCRKC
jgi:hypothetical protein